MFELQNKRNSRKKETAEEFTPIELVNDMLDKLPRNVWDDPAKTFIDPSGGNGNFMVEILKRKLAHNHNPLIALSTLYSVELMEDNVMEMRDRLLIELPSLTPEEAKQARKIINHNIVCHDALTWDYENWKSNTPPKAKPLF
jgi:hypothetical protein